MSIVSTQRASKQRIGNISLKRRYASDYQINMVAQAIKSLKEANDAKTESEYFLRISDAMKVIRHLKPN